MSRRIRNVLLSIVALMLGGSLYILFRETTYIAQLFDWFPYLAYIREFVSVLPCNFVSFYLPDFLWGCALCGGLLAIFDPDIRGSWVCAFAALLWGALWEMLQYTGTVSGTGDIVDIVMYLMAIGVATITHMKG